MGSFLSVISTFVKEIGEGNIDSITLDNGRYLFTEYAGLLFVLRSDEVHEFYEKMLDRWTYSFFLNMRPELLPTLHQNNLHLDDNVYKLIEDQIEDFYFSMVGQLEDHWLDAMKYFPVHLDTPLLKELITYVDQMVEKYPKLTVHFYQKIIRNPYLRHPDVLLMAGVAFGNKIRKLKFPHVSVVREEELYHILDPISISSFDRKTRRVILKLCPFCRGIKSDKPACHFLKGTFIGALDNPHLEVTETQCMVVGADACKFKLLLKSRST